MFQWVVLSGFILSSKHVCELHYVEPGGRKVTKLVTAKPRTTMHRKDLIDILKQSIPSSCTIHLNKRLAKYEKQSPGSLILYFTDDSTSTTDVLVGADGIRSSVRKILFETIGPNIVDPSKIVHYSDPSWTGTLVYRSVIPADKLSKLDPNNVALKDFMIVSPQKAVAIVSNNFHFAVLREGKGILSQSTGHCLLTNI
jgi:2-polyprenyl-6-methoxyphenol hydroxylase-like FAD-dependent oxidoreductase